MTKKHARKKDGAKKDDALPSSARAAQDGKKKDGEKPSPAKMDKIVDEAGDESFPASDPPAWTATIVK